MPKMTIRTDLRSTPKVLRELKLSMPKIPAKAKESTVNFRWGTEVFPFPVDIARSAKAMPLQDFKMGIRKVQTNLLVDFQLPPVSPITLAVVPPRVAKHRNTHAFEIHSVTFAGCTRGIVTIEDSEEKVSFEGNRPSEQLASISLSAIAHALRGREETFLARKIIQNLLFKRRNLGITLTSHLGLNLFNEAMKSFLAWQPVLERGKASTAQLDEFERLFTQMHGPITSSATLNRISFAIGLSKNNLVGSVVF